MESKGRILTAVSGGVDSTAAALLLKKEGYEPEGAVMLLTDDKSAVEAAKKACSWLGIPLHIFDFRKEFREYVTDYFVKTYLEGGTPNPCVTCNRTVKFGIFLAKAKELGFDKIATGHYVKNAYDPETGRYLIKRASCLKKDQSYFLYGLSQEQIKAAVFPLADMDKEDVRNMLEEEGFDNARRGDSQDICFVPDGDYTGFIAKYTGEDFKEGNFVDTAGNILGRHDGIVRYTIGQRKGVRTAFGRPMYVVSKDPVTNEVVMGDNEDLFTDCAYAEQCNFISTAKPEGPLNVTVKMRSVHKDVPCTVIPEKEENETVTKVKILFETPQRAVTLGQSAVFYDGDTVVGGGVITSERDTCAKDRGNGK